MIASGWDERGTGSYGLSFWTNKNILKLDTCTDAHVKYQPTPLPKKQNNTHIELYLKWLK